MAVTFQNLFCCSNDAEVEVLVLQNSLKWCLVQISLACQLMSHQTSFLYQYPNVGSLIASDWNNMYVGSDTSISPFLAYLDILYSIPEVIVKFYWSELYPLSFLACFTASNNVHDRINFLPASSSKFDHMTQVKEKRNIIYTK